MAGRGQKLSQAKKRIFYLPYDLLRSSFSFLSVPDLLHASSASHSFHNAALVVLERDVKQLSFSLIPQKMLQKMPLSFLTTRLSNLSSLSPDVAQMATSRLTDSREGREKMMRAFVRRLQLRPESAETFLSAARDDGVMSLRTAIGLIASANTVLRRSVFLGLMLQLFCVY